MSQIIASDKQNPAPTAQQVIAAWPMYRALVGLGGLCGFLLALVYVLTLPVIQQKQAAHLEQAVLQVIPGAVSKSQWYLNQQGQLEPTDQVQGEGIVYAGYDARGRWLGIAVMAHGMGYQDTIRLLYGVEPISQTLIGLQVLASKETPGLGDKIESEAHFVANFKAMDVTVNEQGSGLSHAIVAVKQGQKSHPWQVDGITGATISSKAVANILNTSAQRWMPIVQQQLTALQSAPEPESSHD